MNPTKLSLAFGKAVRDARLNKGMSQADLSKVTRLSQPHLSKLEAGRRLPEWKTLRRLARAFGANTMAELLLL